MVVLLFIGFLEERKYVVNSVVYTFPFLHASNAV